jgi:hypothetical protein
MGTGPPPDLDIAQAIAELRADLDRLQRRLDALIARRESGRLRSPGGRGAA